MTQGMLCFASLFIRDWQRNAGEDRSYHDGFVVMAIVLCRLCGEDARGSHADQKGLCGFVHAHVVHCICLPNP